MNHVFNYAEPPPARLPRRPRERTSRQANRAVDLVARNASALLAAVRSGCAPFETLRTELESICPTGGPMPRTTINQVVRSIDEWAQGKELTLVRTEPLHWGCHQFAGALRTYLLRTELGLSSQVDAGHSVICATTEEPRRFARHLLRHYVSKRPVYLWTIASGLFRVGGTGEELSFTRPGDPASYRVEGSPKRLSTLCTEEGEEADRLRVLLPALRGYNRCGIGAEDDRHLSGYLKQDELEDGLSVHLIIDDVPGEENVLSDLELIQAYAVVAKAQLAEFCSKLEWPPKSQSLFGGGEKPAAFLGEIQYIMSVQQSRALFVMLDANIFLGSRGDAESSSIAATFLKDASARLRRGKTGTQIVALGTPIPMTRTATDELVCIELPLPSRDELIVELRRQLEKAGVRLTMPAFRGDEAFLISDEMSMLGDAAAGMTLQDVAAAVRRACADGPAAVAAILEALHVGKRAAVKRSPALELVDQLPPRQMSLGGVDRMIAWLGVRRRVFEHPEKAARFGIERRPKGVLLLGIPGSGKSLAAKIIAREWSLPLVRLDMGSIQNMYVGASEQRMREALRIVEAMSPCVLWIDEIDKGVAQGEGTASHSTDLNIRATLLTWLQESRAPVFCVATANRFSNLPPELTRAGRFDARFFLGCPNARGRRQILDIHLSVRGITMDKLATEAALVAMHGFTGAEIEQSVLDGLYSAFSADRPLVPDDIVQAAKRVKPIVRAVGAGLDEVWALLDEGRVELASDEFLNRSDLAKLIDPTLFSPMYCRLQHIGGWEKHAGKAERMLMVDPMGPRAAAILDTGDSDWVYVQTNVRFAEGDQYNYKFLDRVSTIGQNGILDLLLAELGVEIFYVEHQELVDRLKKESWIGGYAEIFKIVASGSEA